MGVRRRVPGEGVATTALVRASLRDGGCALLATFDRPFDGATDYAPQLSTMAYLGGGRLLVNHDGRMLVLDLGALRASAGSHDVAPVLGEDVGGRLLPRLCLKGGSPPSPATRRAWSAPCTGPSRGSSGCGSRGLPGTSRRPWRR